MKYPTFQVDAFTNRPLGGNPCAVIFDADSLETAQMQAIAREMNLSETSFVIEPDPATSDVRARYFTPYSEIPMAGHPTIATIYALAEAGRIPIEGPSTNITLQLEAGLFPIEIAEDSRGRRTIWMTQLPPKFMATLPAKEVMPSFGLDLNDILAGERGPAPIQVVSTGTPQLMIPVKDIETLKRIKVDRERYLDLRTREDFFSVHLFCLGGITDAGATFARHFADSFEDPFTGSATGGMGAYLWHHELIDSPNFVAEQGHGMQRPGAANVEVLGPRDAIEGVRVGGEAVTILRGELEL